MSLSWSSGELITAAKLNRGVPLYVIKGTTQTLVNSTTLQNDSELFLDLAAGRTYFVMLRLIVPTAASNTPDLKVAWSTTGTITLVGARGCRGGATSGTTAADTTMRTTAHGLTTSVPYGGNTAGNDYVSEDLTVQCSVAGRLQLQWAQNTLDAVNSIGVQNLSTIVAYPID